MAVFKEDFARCTECDNAYFTPVRAVILGKNSTDNQIVELKERTEYKCTKCGHVQYTYEGA